MINAAGLFNMTLATVVPGAPVLPAYGHDLSCTTDLDPSMAEVDGIVGLGQSLFRRLITPRGTLLDDQNYGYDVAGFLNDDLGQADLSRIGSGVDAEFAKDGRVLRSASTVTFLTTGILTIASVVTPSTGPTFQLTLAIGNVTASILQVSL